MIRARCSYRFQMVLVMAAALTTAGCGVKSTPKERSGTEARVRSGAVKPSKPTEPATPAEPSKPPQETPQSAKPAGPEGGESEANPTSSEVSPRPTPAPSSEPAPSPAPVNSAEPSARVEPAAPTPAKPTESSPSTPSVPKLPEVSIQEPILPSNPNPDPFGSERPPRDPGVGQVPAPRQEPVPRQEPSARPAPTPEPAPKPEPSPVRETPPTAGAALGKDWVPVEWEKKSAHGREWSKIALSIIRVKAPLFYQGADDIENFCPAFYSLNSAQRENVWVALISAVARWESNYNPYTRYYERKMNKLDAVTGEPLHSEGLLQLSYQDSRSFPQFCSEIDWEKDEKLNDDSTKKTIFNPRINLKCGIQVLHRQIKKHGRISVPKPKAYWAVLMPSGKTSKLPRIQAAVKSLPFCSQ